MPHYKYNRIYALLAIDGAILRSIDLVSCLRGEGGGTLGLDHGK